MLEHYKDIDEGVQLQIINEARINFYNNKDAPTLWTGEFYWQLILAISPYIKTTATSNKTSEGGSQLSEKDYSQANRVSTIILLYLRILLFTIKL